MWDLKVERFDEWNRDKKFLHIKKDSGFKYVKESDIWYVKLGCNIGFESDGKGKYLRPFLVVKKIGNLFFGIPLSTKYKDNKYYFLLKNVLFKQGYMKDTSSVLLSQGRVIDRRRFIKKIGYVESEEFENIKKILKEMYL